MSQQMMNELAEEECDKGPQQSQSPYSATFGAHEQQYLSREAPVQQSKGQLPASHQQNHAGQDFLPRQISHQRSASRHHPYARPSVPIPGSIYQTSASGNDNVRHVGPVRHDRTGLGSQVLNNSQQNFKYPSSPAQQGVFNNQGYQTPSPPSYGIDHSNFSGQRTPHGGFRKEHALRSQDNYKPPYSSVADDQFSYHGQQYGVGRPSQDPRYAAYLQRVATLHGPSPYLPSSSHVYSTSHTAANVATSNHGRHHASERIKGSQTQNFQPHSKEADKSNGKKGRPVEIEKFKEETKSPRSRGKGKTRFKNGRLEYIFHRDAAVKQWEPAVHMDDCRRELIDQQNRLAAQLGMRYYEPDPKGTGSHDETAFKVEHADWGEDRAHLPDICWRFKEDEASNPRPKKDPGYMWFQGMIVLDPNDEPVKDWPQLPLTLSSKVPGYKVEVMSRENPHLEYKDFVARMPSVIEKPRRNKDTGKMETVIEAPDVNAVCNMRMIRFREKKGMLAWTNKENSDHVAEGLTKLFGESLVNNSMKSFGRDLMSWEQTEVKKGKAAQFPQRHHVGAATQATTQDEKAKSVKKAATKEGNAGAAKIQRQKRPREDNEDFHSPGDQKIGRQTMADSDHKRRRKAMAKASKPVVVLDGDEELPATAMPPRLVRVGSNPPLYTPSNLPHQGYDADKSDCLSGDQNRHDKDFETRERRRPTHPLPTRRMLAEAKTIRPCDLVLPQAQDGGNIGSQANVIDKAADEHVTDKEALAGSVSNGNPQAPFEDVVGADIEAVNGDDLGPPVPQETDLERHRRLTRGFLGERDVFYFLPGSKPPSSDLALFKFPRTE